MRQNRHLVVFAKAPDMGRVKSRLAKDIGLMGATRFYRRTVDEVLRRLERNARWTGWLALSPDKALHGRRFWPPSYIPIAQGGGDLGERMDRVMYILPPGPVVIIGTDVPAITPEHIDTAFRKLGRYDAVFGPAEDGGYWLVGARRSPCLPDLFSGIRWSTPHTLADTTSKLTEKGLKVALIDTLSDVDDGAAYDRWRGKIKEV